MVNDSCPQPQVSLHCNIDVKQQHTLPPYRLARLLRKLKETSPLCHCPS